MSDAAWPFDHHQMFGYDFIMADPAWRLATWSEAGKGEKSPEAHYDTMLLQEIADLPVGLLASKHAVLWLWATSPMIDQQIWLLKHWGFQFATMGCWNKKTRNGKYRWGPGYRLRTTMEPFLIGTMGSPITSRSIPSGWDGLARGHSRKPEEGYDLAEKMMPRAKRMDLFSRQTRPGWECWGREIGKFDNGEPPVVKKPKVKRIAYRDEKTLELL